MSDATMWAAPWGQMFTLAGWAGAGLSADTLLSEHRPPTIDDLPDITEQVAKAAEDAIDEAVGLCGAGVDIPRLVAHLRGPLREALALTVDLSIIAWVPTGRTMTVGEARARKAVMP